MTTPNPGDRGFPPELEALGKEYEFLREIGAGGMAAVYLARERSGGRLVAIKAIRRRYLEDEEALSRFDREARVVAELHHPNIVETYAVRHTGEKTIAIVMQHLPGGTLRQALQRGGAFSFDRAAAVLRDVAEALRHAHGRGVVHRDVKPENIFLEEETGRALLSDFGIARPMVESDDQLTMVGAAIGTPTYMAPEQIDGLPLDDRSDVYSLGVVGWEMLTGRRPWEGESLYSIIYKQKHEELPRLPELRPGIPTSLLFAIEGALHKHRDTRWTNMDEFLAQLREESDEVAMPRAAEDTGRGDAVADLFAAWSQMMREHPEAGEPPQPPEGRERAREDDEESGEIVGPSKPVWARKRGRWSGFPRWQVAGSGSGPPEPEPRAEVPPLRILEPARPRRSQPLVIGALAAAAVLVAVLAIEGVRRSRAADDQMLAADSLRPTVTGGALGSDEDTARVGAPDAATLPSPPARTDRSAAAPAVPPARSREPTVVPAATVVARTRIDSLLLCDSPVQSHQRACLFAHISENDGELNRVYRELIAELQRRADSVRAGEEPESVQQLRAAQREWLANRDEDCRARSPEREGELWAPVRARCFAELSDLRTRELTAQLQRVRG